MGRFHARNDLVYAEGEIEERHWFNERLHELEDKALPVMEERGDEWFFIGHPRFRQIGVIEYYVIGVPFQRGRYRYMALGWYTIDEFITGKYLEKATKVGNVDDNRKTGPKLSKEDANDPQQIMNRVALRARVARWQKDHLQVSRQRNRKYQQRFVDKETKKK